MSQEFVDIDLYFNNGNLGLGVTNPSNKLEVTGAIKSNEIKLNNTNINDRESKFEISNNDGSKINLSKEKSVINSNKIGINNLDPQYTFDIAGDFRVENNIYGNNNNIIISHDESLNIDPNNKYASVDFNNNVNISKNLSVTNKIMDNMKNEFVDFDYSGSFVINNNDPVNKSLSFYGQANFIDNTHGVNIGQNKKANKGELYVENKIKTNNIEFEDTPNKKLSLEGENSSNISLGKYTNLSNTSEQTSLFGNNLYAKDDKVKIAKTSESYGYRGISMNEVNGIQFYSMTGDVDKDNFPDLPNLTLSNTGQLITSIPVLPFTFEIDDLENNVYKYIRDLLGNKRIGSMMTFTTNEYLIDDKIFNVIKNSATTSKSYIIDKKTNNVIQYFDISLL